MMLKKDCPDKDLPTKKLLRVNEAAVYFGVCERTIREWIAQKKLGAIKPTGTIFIPREAIKKFLVRDAEVKK